MHALTDGITHVAETVQNLPLFQTVILSEAKDLLSFRSPRKQILRFAQDDSSIGVYFPAGHRNSQP